MKITKKTNAIFELSKRTPFRAVEKKSRLKEAFYSDKSSNKPIQLLSYSTLLNIEVDWITRKSYLDLIKKFIEQKSSIDDFCNQFCERAELNDNTVDFLKSNLILLSLNQEALDFSELLEEIFDVCELRPEEAIKSNCLENNLLNLFEKSFFKIQNYLKD
jgi:hypothetical protein